MHDAVVDVLLDAVHQLAQSIAVLAPGSDRPGRLLAEDYLPLDLPGCLLVFLGGPGHFQGQTIWLIVYEI